MSTFWKVRPTFWTGSAVRTIRGDATAIALLCYLKTSDAGNMTGLYRLTMDDASRRLGLPVKAVRKAMGRLEELGQAYHDPAAEAVLVADGAKDQIGHALTMSDKRRGRVLAHLAEFSDTYLLGYFLHLYDHWELRSPFSSPFPEPEKPHPTRAISNSNSNSINTLSSSALDAPRSEQKNPEAKPDLEAIWLENTGRAHKGSATKNGTARINDGASVEDLALVARWAKAIGPTKYGDAEKAKLYLRPDTVWAAGHWDDYLVNATEWAEKTRNGHDRYRDPQADIEHIMDDRGNVVAIVDHSKRGR